MNAPKRPQKETLSGLGILLGSLSRCTPSSQIVSFHPTTWLSYAEKLIRHLELQESEMTIPKDFVAKRCDDYPVETTTTNNNNDTTNTTVESSQGEASVTPNSSPKTTKEVRFGGDLAIDDKSSASSAMSASSLQRQGESDEEVERRLARSANKVMSKQALQKAHQLLKQTTPSYNKRARRRKSPLPAEGMTAAEEIKFQLDRMELKIRKAAKMELALLNQSKKIRDQRTAYQRRYEKLSTDYKELVQKSHPENAVVAPNFELPPVFPKPGGGGGLVDLTQDE